MQYLERLSLLPALLLLLISCKEPERQNAVDYHIEWDESSLVCIADEGAYPRLRRLDDGSLLATYENRRGDVMVRKSIDNGTTWGEPVVAFSAFDFEDINTGERGQWGSLTDLGGNTIAALSSTNFNSDKIGVWMIKGEIVKNKPITLCNRYYNYC